MSALESTATSTPASMSVAEHIGQQQQQPSHPQVSITFLLVTGPRRTLSFDPSTTIGRVKELVWSGWSAEWQEDPTSARPPSPSFIRILHLGRILLDDESLTSLKFPLSTNPLHPTTTIVHLSIRPADVPLPKDDSAGKKKRRGGGASSGAGAGDAGGVEGADLDEEPVTGCCCVIC